MPSGPWRASAPPAMLPATDRSSSPNAVSNPGMSRSGSPGSLSWKASANAEVWKSCRSASAFAASQAVSGSGGAAAPFSSRQRRAMPSSHPGSRSGSRREKNQVCKRSRASGVMPSNTPLNAGSPASSFAMPAAASTGALSGCAGSESAMSADRPNRPETVWRESRMVGSCSSRGSRSRMSTLMRCEACWWKCSRAPPAASSTARTAVARQGASRCEVRFAASVSGSVALAIRGPEIHLDHVRWVLRVALDPAEVEHARLAVGQEVFPAAGCCVHRRKW